MFLLKLIKYFIQTQPQQLPPPLLTSTASTIYSQTDRPLSSYAVSSINTSTTQVLSNISNSTQSTSQNNFLMPSISNNTVLSSSSNVLIGRVLPENFPYTCLNAQAIVNRIYAKMPECEGIDDEAIQMISNVIL